MSFKKSLPFFIAISIFIIASLAYFSPVLDGKELFQSDIAQFRGMAKEVQDFRAKTGEEPYWTNRAFGGMPTYQLSSYYPHDYIKKLDGWIRFLPRPADYLFLYFISFFVLLLSLKVNWKTAVIGALGFGFSTYLIIILGVGHNAKAHAIGYMPLVLAGLVLIFDKRYVLGFITASLALSLEIAASHPQMTYYLLFFGAIFGLVKLFESIKEKSLADYFKSLTVFFVASFLALGMNATSLLATKEYAAESTRSKSELTINPDGSEKEATGGLSKEYITEYSYGIVETFNLFIPRFKGGSNNENLGTDSNIYNFLKDKAGRKQALGFAENAPMYWGDQPIVAAPAYIGAVLIFLFVIGVFLVNQPWKKWLIISAVFSILLSWGKNFGLLTDLFIDFMPLYNKFRAVSSIQVIAELAIPLLAILGLQALFKKDISSEQKLRAVRLSFYITGGIALFFALFGTGFFSFESFRDASYESMLPGLSDVIIEDRKEIFRNDSFRSFIFVFLTAALAWFFVKGRLNKNVFWIGILVITLTDLVVVDRRYVNNEDFVTSKNLENPFPKTQINDLITEDKGHYRVMNFTVNPMNDGSTSFYHNSIGGYHAAKPRRYQELFDFQIAKNNMEVLNMLNTKYFIYPDQNNTPQVQINEEANGNAWFVNKVKLVDSANEEILSLDSLKTKEEVVVHREYENLMGELNKQKDSSATITLIDYAPNKLEYKSSSIKDQLAIFSEVYYKNGWNAYVDGVIQPHFRANYVLRGMNIPAGNHTVLFKFEPKIIRTGTTISLISYLAFVFLTIAGYFLLKKRK
ncbi:YfhO family protein [Namhaeicola litoreus]|uniref:YfhO family protein n=1 Tax=Namhaeicola litoreus TaxID=1052145 RepID=A0ABW3Y166_9FLAO